MQYWCISNMFILVLLWWDFYIVTYPPICGIILLYSSSDSKTRFVDKGMTSTYKICGIYFFILIFSLKHCKLRMCVAHKYACATAASIHIKNVVYFLCKIIFTHYPHSPKVYSTIQLWNQFPFTLLCQNLHIILIMSVCIDYYLVLRFWN